MDAGGKEDFESLYQSHYEVVRRYINRQVYDTHLVDDLCADVFETALTSLGTFDPTRGTFRQWLIGITRHRLSRLWQTTVRAREARARLAGLEAAYRDEPGIERAEWRAMAEGLHRELKGLPDMYRIALDLRFLHDCTYEQISALVGCPPATARVRVHRGLAILRTRLDPE